MPQNSAVLPPGYVRSHVAVATYNKPERPHVVMTRTLQCD